MDINKKYESYKGLQTSFQQHFNQAYNGKPESIG